MSNTSNLLKVALVANIFEWYEFTIYAYLADIIAQLFFVVTDPVSGLIKTFAVYATGFLARPFGSLLFGIMGDRVGRRRPLTLSMMIMALPTVFIGLLPTYQDTGLLAPVLLLTLRIIQGFATGGELTVDACYIFEAAPINRRSILCSVVTASSSLGFLLASSVAFLLSSLFDHQTILLWAWRLPFLLSFLMVCGIYIIRRSIHELPMPPRHPPAFAFRVLKQSLLNPLLLIAFLTVSSVTLLVWMPAYLTYFLHYPPRLAHLSNLFTIMAIACFYLVGGMLSQFLGYQQVIQLGIGCVCIWIMPLFIALQQASYRMILTISLILALLLGSVGGVSMEALAQQFPQFVRCRGMNLGYTLPVVFLGGTTPLFLTWVIDKTGLLLFPAFYIACLGLFAFSAAFQLENPRAAERVILA